MYPTAIGSMVDNCFAFGAAWCCVVLALPMVIFLVGEVIVILVVFNLALLV